VNRSVNYENVEKIEEEWISLRKESSLRIKGQGRTELSLFVCPEEDG
jgi:hypothetical protein